MSIITGNITADLIGTPDIALGRVSGRATLDESWAPYVQADLTISMPDSATLELLDPRELVRIRITASSNSPYVPFVPRTRTFDLGLRSRTTDYTDGTVRLELATDEALLMDDVWADVDPNDDAIVHAGSLRAILDDVILTRIGAHLEAGDADASYPTTPDADALLWQPGVRAWDFIQPLFQQAGLRLFCDEQRRWYLVDGVQFIAAGLLDLELPGSVHQLVDTTDRDSDEWFDAAVVTYRWLSSVDDSPVVQHDVYAPPGSTRTAAFEIEHAYPGPGAAQYAVTKATNKGHTADVVALANLGVTPSQVVRITLPDETLLAGLVRTVSIDLDRGLMNVTTRGLTDVGADAILAFPSGVRIIDLPGIIKDLKPSDMIVGA